MCTSSKSLNLLELLIKTLFTIPLKNNANVRSTLLHANSFVLCLFTQNALPLSTRDKLFNQVCNKQLKTINLGIAHIILSNQTYNKNFIG